VPRTAARAATPKSSGSRRERAVSGGVADAAVADPAACSAPTTGPEAAGWSCGADGWSSGPRDGPARYGGRDRGHRAGSVGQRCPVSAAAEFLYFLLGSGIVLAVLFVLILIGHGYHR
jgi:hypothetical protein